ncbi:N-acetylmuramic acid 6-phosphate etherase [Aliiruegeria sabulilitoris]|uniref:N-acetylmuramic acid 6-phosphate etherase n=1 Tax=Aliiruegeria sabulilitoris TaxID=1510458 RepID=UPI0008309F85|nr:N-acetylmuramic acid 6-phosphate etherase [Aliiruegeria sabulilitoris]NDR55200.1 N-acetylmuramic acid 6-phosphate etherase [Pseudoruegeria sp. M32A2M]
MPLPATEHLHPDAPGLDTRPLGEVATLLLEGQLAALQAVRPALDAIAQAARLMAETLRNGGTLSYVAAGSSGLMALADAAELGGTFGIPADRIRFSMAGGVPVTATMPGDTEDDSTAAQAAAAETRPGDLVIALSASGSTPYPLAYVAAAREKGARVVAIANNPDTPLLQAADVAICLATPPEVISGSTRLGAGTAQKTALNIASTLMGIELGHVHDGMMVNLVADNEKLRGRAAGIVSRIAGVPEETALACLDRSGGAVKPAVLLAAGHSETEATQALAATHGRIRDALSDLQTRKTN